MRTQLKNIKFCWGNLFAIQCLLFLANGFGAQAQQKLPVKYIGIESGLSNNSITCIYQDKYNFIWLGTYDGLNRYDGSRMKIFRHRFQDSNSLINNRITGVAEDKEDRLWVATKKGVSIYSNKQLAFAKAYYHKSYGNRANLSPVDMPVNEIVADTSGNIFMAGSGSGLMYYDNATSQTRQIALPGKYASINNYQVQSIAIDRNGTPWVFVDAVGLFTFNYRHQSLAFISDGVTRISLMKWGKENQLWIAGGNTLYEFHPTDKSIVNRGLASPGGEIISCLLADDCGLYVGTDGGGIRLLDYKHKNETTTLNCQSIFAKPTSDAIAALYKDKNGNKWIGTLRAGINFISNAKTPFDFLTKNPSSGTGIAGDFTAAFSEDKEGNTWIGFDGNGISIWNRKNGVITNLNHTNSGLANNMVTDICRTHDGRMWVSTYGGGISLYNNRGKFSTYRLQNWNKKLWENNAWVIFEDSQNRLWAGTVTGSLYKFNEVENRFDVFDDNLSDILCITEDSEGNLWGGNFGSFIKIDPVNKQHTFYPTENPVRSVHEDKAGDLWVGTEGSGLLLFDKQQGNFRSFTEEDGLANNAILRILEDDEGNLWMSTFNGLSKKTFGSNHFKNFFQSDGLLSNQFNYNAAYKYASGELCFGSIKGLNFFHPDNLNLSHSSNNLLITDLRIDNKPIATNNEYLKGQVLYNVNNIVLPYDQAVLSVEYASPEFNAPDQVAYAYYLEGWDKDWNYVGKTRTANYSSLRSGKYKLHIKSTNASGAWSNSEKIISIIVTPAWFNTWWAYSLYALLAAGLIYCFIRYKTKQSKLAYEIKLAHMNAAQAEALNQKKLDFFTHVAHEFRTPITLIINPIKDFLSRKDLQPDPAELQIVHRNSHRLLSLVDQLLLFKKAEAGINDLRVSQLNLAHVCREVFLCFIQQAKSQQIDYSFESCFDDITMFADREKLEIAVFNVVSNALKFTPTGGSVKVSLVENGNSFEIRVADTGCGIAEEVGDKLFERFYQSRQDDTNRKAGFGIGLYLAKSFIAAHHGSLVYETRLNAGTTFSVSLLKGKAHFKIPELSDNSVAQSQILEELKPVDDFIIDQQTIKEQQNEVLIEELVTETASVLIVDDNEGIRDYLKQVFSDGFRLYEAENGKEGLRLAKKYVPDIVISDIVMEKMSGLEFCAAIKEDAALSQIQVILLTGSGSDEIRLRGVECGADDYITKPFESQLLLARVNSLLKSRNNLQKYFYNEITFRKNELSISSEHKIFLERCIEVIESKLDTDDFSIKVFAKEMQMSHSSLYKKVKQMSGQSINGFIRFIRLRKAAELLITTDYNVSEVAFQVGIADGKYFRLQFVKLFGMVPSEYKKKFQKPFQKNFSLHEKVMASGIPVED